MHAGADAEAGDELGLALADRLRDLREVTFFP
jgi:hypothetical protein